MGEHTNTYLLLGTDHSSTMMRCIGQEAKTSLNPFKPYEIFQSYHLDQSFFSFKGCWMVFFIFIQFLIEYSEINQWKPGSEAAFYGVWSGYALFANVPQKGSDDSGETVWMSRLV